MRSSRKNPDKRKSGCKFSERVAVRQHISPFAEASYETVYTESIQQPELFWAEVGRLVTWSKPWKKVLDNSNEPFTKWFVGGELNACYNALDRHVEAGLGSKVALIYDSPLLGVIRKITYGELLEKVSKLAGLLLRLGIEKGDMVIIYMPLIPETVMAMLAVARIGAVHAVIFGGYAASELASRIQHTEAKVVIAASCGLEPNRIVDYIRELNDAITMSSHKPSNCIIFQRKDVYIGDLDPRRDLDWEEAVKNAEGAPCVPVGSNDLMYILYTSGTTDDPKGITRTLGDHLPVLIYTMKVLFGLIPEDTWWATSDFGWAVGHSYMCYGPLAYGMTTVIYEGKPTTTPDPSSYYRIIDNYRVSSLFTVPTAMRVLKHADPECKYGSEYDLSSLRHIWLAGEHLDFSTKLWTEKIFEVPVINHYWQTETGSPVTGMCQALKNPCTSSNLTVGLPVMGYDIRILRKDGREADRNELGRVVFKLPLPPGTSTNLHKASDKFVTIYFTKYPGFYDTMDVGYLDNDGLLYVTARADDVINVAGHRVSTFALENIILSHPDVLMACVTSVPDSIKNEVPLCLFVVKEDALRSDYVISQELVTMVRDNLGPVAAFKLAAAVRALPMTRTGKIMRKSIGDLARNQLVKISGAVVDPTVYEDITEILKKFGFC